MPSTDVDHDGSATGGRPGDRPEGSFPRDGENAEQNKGPAVVAASVDAARATPALGPVGRFRRRLRVGLGRVKRRMVRVTRVRYVGWDTVEVSLFLGLRRTQYHLSGPVQRPVGTAGLVVRTPDPAAFDRLVAAGVLRGNVRRLRVRVGSMPAWLRGGLRLPRIARDAREISWQVRGGGVEIRLAWRGPRPIPQALAELSSALLRPRRWDQTGGPVYATGRKDWLRGTSPWPQAVLGTAEAGPFTRVGRLDPAVPARLVTAVANPHGRRLLGRATPYELKVIDERVELRTPDGSPVLRFDPSHALEQTLLHGTFDKYAVATAEHIIPNSGSAFVRTVLETLGACGMVFAADSPSGLNLVTVADADAVDDLAGYQASVAASRRAMIGSDPALRRSTLAGGPVPVPAVSVVIASKRPDDIATCLGDFAHQTYPSYEIVLGTHGYEIDEAQRRALAERLSVPLRVIAIPEDRTLGEVLGILSRHADGELVSKADDDDRYGPDHLTDLFLALRGSGADLVAKSARFVYLADEDVTIDRTWAAPEAFSVTPAGGTLLLSRGTLQAAGGWSGSPRHVDADLLTRVKAIGGVTYRTHGLGYVYVRRRSGHTWQTDAAELSKHGEVLYEGLPQTLLAGERCGAT